MISLAIINYHEICGCMTSNIIVCNDKIYSKFIKNNNFGINIKQMEKNILLDIMPYKCQHNNDLMIIRFTDDINEYTKKLEYKDFKKYFKNELCYKI